jgi:glutathione S-transferase
MSKPLRLHYAPDNASLPVRLALEELGAHYETVLVDRARQQQRSAAYLRLNPAGLIPVLETPDGTVFETAAILLWLADRHGALAPQPQDATRGAFLKWLFFTSNTLHAGLRMRFHPDRYAGGAAAARTALLGQMAGEHARHLALLDANAGEWDQGLTMLHLYLAPILRWCALYPLGETDWFRLGDYPALARLCETLEARTATRAVARAEGLGPHPFTAPVPAQPREGSAI